MNTIKKLTAIAIAVVTLAATAAPSEAYTQRIPAQAGATSAGAISSTHATSGSGFRLPPSCHPYKPGCLHIQGDRPGAPKKSGNGVPDTGINCTYTTHGLCSPD